MPEITTAKSQLYSPDKGTRMHVGTVIFSEEEWGNMTQKEKKHARNCSSVDFKSLVWYAQEMKNTRCTYKQAVINVLRKSE